MKSGLWSSGGRGLATGSSAGIRYERDDERRHEHAHRPLVGRQLDVEIRQAEQPDERRERRRRADERRVPDVHRLHADEERVGENSAAEDRRRQPPDARIPPREVGQVGGRRRSVEDERNEVHDTYRLGFRSVVALARARGQARLVSTRTTTRRQAPLRIGFLDEYARLY